MSGVFNDQTSAYAGRDMSPGDAGLFVEIYDEPVEQPFLTKQAGHPIFEDRTFIRIMVPGDNLNVINREIRPDDKARFPRHWALYEQMKRDGSVGDMAQPGYAVEQWPVISRATAKTLRGLGFHTVEQIAAASDQNIQRLGMAVGMTPTTFRDKAKEFLARSHDAAASERLAQENSELRTRIDDLEALVKRLAAQAEAVQSEKRPRKGAEG